MIRAGDEWTFQGIRVEALPGGPRWEGDRRPPALRLEIEHDDRRYSMTLSQSMADEMEQEDVNRTIAGQLPTPTPPTRSR